jgi:hypothetical protein
MNENDFSFASLPADLLRHALAFSEDTARHVAWARGVCVGWTRALSSDALRTNGGLEGVRVDGNLRPRLNETELSCVLGLRTRILHVEVVADVLRLASEQCSQLSELRVVRVSNRVELAPRWPLLTRLVFER